MSKRDIEVNIRSSRREKIRKAKKSSPVDIEDYGSDKVVPAKKRREIDRKLARKKKQLLSVLDEQNTIKVPSTVGNREQEYLDTYTELFNTTKELIKIAEMKYIKSEQSRDVYALMTMYSQLREIIADLRSISDVGQQADALITDVLEPTMQSIAQVVIDMYYQISDIIRQNCEPNKVDDALASLKLVTGAHAKRIEDNFDTAKEKIKTTLTVNK